LCWLGCDEIANAARKSGLNDASAAQNIGAGLCPAAEMVLASCVLNSQRQLAGGNSSGAENSDGHRRKNCVFDCLIAHDSLLFIAGSRKDAYVSYLAGDCSPVGCNEQNPTVDSRGKAQMQPLEQGCVALQAPRQAAKPFASARNWRAETVPAKRTAVTTVASNVGFMNFLLMIALLSNYRAGEWP
jgi:hypothetical protein